jgi:hypothetical protein
VEANNKACAKSAAAHKVVVNTKNAPAHEVVANTKNTPAYQLLGWGSK